MVIDRLRRLLPADAILSSAEELKPYECDALTLYRQTPLAVALPADETQVSAVLKTCHEAGVPVIARGAGTGLSGGATPRPDAVLMSLARLNRIISLEPLARTARVTGAAARAPRQTAARGTRAGLVGIAAVNQGTR